jgi:hypothetical protein
MLPKDHLFSELILYFAFALLIFILVFFTTEGVKCRVAAVKSCPVLYFSFVIFSGPSESLMPALLSVKN